VVGNELTVDVERKRKWFGWLLPVEEGGEH